MLHMSSVGGFLLNLLLLYRTDSETGVIDCVTSKSVIGVDSNYNLKLCQSGI